MNYLTSHKPVIAVTMATSRQGMAVIRHLSNKGYFKVLGITRNPLSKRAIKLSSLPNVELIKGDLLEPETLFQAFKGVYGIFGNTTPTRPWGMEKEYEMKQGINLINVVNEVSKLGHLKHFIFSSVCKGKNILSDAIAPNHFSTKWKLEKYILSKEFSKISTILRPASYFENFNNKLFDFLFYMQLFPGVVNPSSAWQTLSVDDVGLWAAAAFHNQNKFIGQSLNLASEELTGEEMASLLTSLRVVNSTKVKYIMIPRFIINILEHDIATMANWIEKKGYGANINYLNKLSNELGIKTTSLATWLKKENHTQSDIVKYSADPNKRNEFPSGEVIL
tara:strand:+ start:54 stop:1058 length:1005 start_codon:yes stop_codon:yes gene_type:complete